MSHLVEIPEAQIGHPGFERRLVKLNRTRIAEANLSRLLAGLCLKQFLRR
jgi:hypothetical protein